MDIRTVNLILKMIDGLKFLAPVFASVYFVVWLIQFFNEGLFNFLNKIFGFLPDIFNNIFDITSDIMGQDVLMGYPYIALLFIAGWGLLYKIDKIVKEKTSHIDFGQKEHNISQKKLKKQTKTENNLKNPAVKKSQTPSQGETADLDKDISSFYGLLTFELKYTNDDTVDEEMQKILKHGYTKILVEKLKEKYGSVNYAVSDKVFFICNNVSLFNLFVRDIIQLNKTIAKISLKREIKTALKVCFWSSPNANPKKACAILLRINQLNYLNKIIVSKHIQLKFDRQLIKCFDFCSLGTVKLSKLNTKDNDIDMELFYLKTLDV